MAIVYSWQIMELDVVLGPDANDHTDVVYEIAWRYNAVDDENPRCASVITSSSTVEWKEGNDWIPYEDLTEADIVGWIEEDIGEDQLAHMKSQLDAQVEEKRTPTHKANRFMPWNEVDGA